MYALGQQLAQMYLSPNDKLIGVIGDAGSGKSSLIRGMFPGLELTNDDNGVYVRPLPILDLVGFGGGFGGMGGFDGGFGGFGGAGALMGFHMAEPHTYHLDIRFENGFTQMSVLADAIAEALDKGKRVIVEHFDLVYPLLGANANLLIGIGEQVLISRPTIFGPEPDELKEAVYESLHYRLMAHSAEDICEMFIDEFDVNRCGHDDVRHGFAIYFPDTCPSFDIAEVERKVNEIIAQDVPITYIDDSHISVGDNIQSCDGPRFHVKRTGQIENFHLMNHLIYDRFKSRYLLVGCVGEKSEELLKRLDNQHQSPGWY
jgi:GTPase SAR1 family protein